MGNKTRQLLMKANPDLYAELHPTLNTIDTTILSPGSNKKVWWQCSKNISHSWQASVSNRAQGSGCAMCSGKFVIHGVNDLSVSNPQLYSELHPTMNTIDTTTLTAGSHKKVWWQCSESPSHYWEASVSQRVRGRGCPLCVGQFVVHGVNDLSVLRPDLYAELHPTMNTIDTTILSSSSAKKLWWQCVNDPSHYWYAALSNRYNGSGCAMCSGKFVVHGVNDLSVLRPDLYAELHPTMNTIDTTTLTPGSHKKVWWQCSETPSHYWQASVNSRSQGSGCPY